MLIVTTLYCMELETAKKLASEKPAGEESGATIPLDDREFLGIYQGRSGVKPSEQ